MKDYLDAVIVVEGINDISKISHLFDVLDFVKTNGYAINNEDLIYLKSIQNDYRIIVLTDSDLAGEKIRQNLLDSLDVYISLKVDKTKCLSKRKHGVAECDDSELREKLKTYINNSKRVEDKITKADLFELKLIGNNESRMLRDSFASKYQLGICNSNNFIRRCTIKHIDKNLL